MEQFTPMQVCLECWNHLRCFKPIDGMCDMYQNYLQILWGKPLLDRIREFREPCINELRINKHGIVYNTRKGNFLLNKWRA